ncbi:MAG: hypothetical protein R3D02_05420 [Hyphomicrobiales bacterium]
MSADCKRRHAAAGFRAEELPRRGAFDAIVLLFGAIFTLVPLLLAVFLWSFGDRQPRCSGRAPMQVASAEVRSFRSATAPSLPISRLLSLG